MHTRSLILITVLQAGYGVFADNFEPLGTKTFAEIKSAYEGKPFLLSLWSIDCAPCRLELKLLGELKKSDPDFPLVLISADSMEQRETASYILEEYNLEHLTSWMFEDDFTQRLRYSIDPNWYGELPRSYLFDAEHKAIPHSGVLTEEQLASFTANIRQ